MNRPMVGLALSGGGARGLAHIGVVKVFERWGVPIDCLAGASMGGILAGFFSPEGNMRWGGRFLIDHNRSQYPTHAVGPVWPWLNLGCGDYFDTAVTMASRSLGINDYFGRKFGPKHPYAAAKFSQGDVVTTLIKTKKGNTVFVKYDMQLPRPYDNQWELQGTRGIYNEQRNAVYLVDRSPEYHQWEPFPPYMEKHDHLWWRARQRHHVGLVAHPARACTPASTGSTGGAGRRGGSDINDYLIFPERPIKWRYGLSF